MASMAAGVGLREPAEPDSYRIEDVLCMATQSRLEWDMYLVGDLNAPEMKEQRSASGLAGAGTLRVSALRIALR